MLQRAGRVSEQLTGEAVHVPGAELLGRRHCQSDHFRQPLKSGFDWSFVSFVASIWLVCRTGDIAASTQYAHLQAASVRKVESSKALCKAMRLAYAFNHNDNEHANVRVCHREESDLRPNVVLCTRLAWL